MLFFPSSQILIYFDYEIHQNQRNTYYNLSCALLQICLITALKKQTRMKEKKKINIGRISHFRKIKYHTESRTEILLCLFIFCTDLRPDCYRETCNIYNQVASASDI